MIYLFWITLVISIGILIFRIKRNSENIYILFGVYFPLILYFFKWSDYINQKPGNIFYYIFILFNSIVIVFNIPKIRAYKNNLTFDVKRVKLLKYANLFFIGLYLLESYIGSGSFIPYLKGIDIHTYSAPFIAYFTRNLYCIMAIDMLFFLKTKKKRYLLWILIIILIPVVTRGARIVIVVATMQIILMTLAFYMMKGKIKKELIIKVVLIAVIGIGSLTAFTNYRMKNTTTQKIKYSQLIEYTGPKVLNTVLPVYYGYFPMSYNNLNINLNRIASGKFVPQRTYGLYTFQCVFFAIFQLQRIMGLNSNYIGSNIIYPTGAAAVPTMFYGMYYDFGLLIFIPIIIFLGVTAYLRKNKRKNMTYFLIYFYFVPNWMLAGFQNALGAAPIVWGIIICIVLVKIFIKEEKYD